MEEGLFYENDVRVTKIAVKAIRWLVFVFPVLMILSIAGVFQTKVSELIPLTVFAIVVTMEIGKLHEVEQEAQKIGTLQEQSREKTRIAADSSKHTCERGEQLLDMIGQMEDLVKSTIAQADRIVAQTQTQKNVTDEVEQSFRQVNAVSENLLQISQAGKEASGEKGDKGEDETF